MDPDATLMPSSESAPTSQPSTLHKVFIGKDGLRAGWSLFLFILLFAGMVFCARFIIHKFYPWLAEPPKLGMEIPPSLLLINELVPFLITVLATWIMSKIERRPNSVYGLGGSRKPAYFLAGLAWGVTCLSILVLILLKTGLLVIDRRLLVGGEVVRYGALWLLVFLLVGCFEEYLTRGYVQYTLSRGLAGVYQWVFKTRFGQALGFWSAAVIFSVLFGLGHGKNPGESPIGLLSAGLAAMVFCFSLWRTGSLWWAIGFHTTWDWGQSFLYGVADSGMMGQHHLLATHAIGAPILSGGTTGPEGSIYIIAVLAFAALIIFFTLPKSAYGDARRDPRL